ncbi:MAG: DUF368 domain-containing protein [Oscillospiraceae bacterium]
MRITRDKIIDVALRFFKGLLIGTGFILPGVSGGALAAIFGLYERMISFVAHLNRDFKKNLLFFLPVGIGMLAGIVLLSYPLGFFLDRFSAQTMWCFIGCILGTLPSLWKQSGKKGRKPKHIVILIVSFAFGLVFLSLGGRLFSGAVPQTFLTWMLAGAIIGLGILIPGLSPSNFLLYMGMYTPMVEAFQKLNLMVILPLGLGGLICMLGLSRLFDWIFQKAYAGMFHFVLGIVMASVFIIIPLDFNYLSLGGLACIPLCLAGIALGWWMSRLEETYKPAE